MYTRVNTLAICRGDLLAGTFYGGVWRRPLSDMLTAVNAPAAGVSARFNLGRCHPNPFNPSTTLGFGLPEEAFVELTIFDAMGKEIATLLSRKLPAGSYTQRWNAGGLPGGVYFCRMTARAVSGGLARAYVRTEKMILMK